MRQTLANKGLFNRVEILPDAIDTQTCNDIKNIYHEKVSLGLSNRKVILFVGRKCPEKGPQILVSALKSVIIRYPETIAVFIGPDNYFGSNSNSYTKYLFKLVEKFNLQKHVLFKGFIPDHELKKYYNAADIFVCPSIWNEPFGMVLLEALSFKKPVIASEVGGIPEIIIQNQTGLLTKPGDHEELSSAILNLFDNVCLAKKLGKNGRYWVQHNFSFEAVANRCLKIYEKLLA